MSSQNEQQKTNVNRDSKKTADNETWLDRNLPVLVGGGTFGLLFLITLVMYYVNN